MDQSDFQVQEQRVQEFRDLTSKIQKLNKVEITLKTIQEDDLDARSIGALIIDFCHADVRMVSRESSNDIRMSTAAVCAANDHEQAEFVDAFLRFARDYVYDKIQKIEKRMEEL